MSSEVDHIVSVSKETIRRSQRASGRVRPIGQKSKALRRTHLWAKMTRIFTVGGTILVGAIVFGLIRPLGFIGLLAVALLLVVSVLAFAKWPRFSQPDVADLSKTDLKQFAGRTEIWLETQHSALPPPARALIERIGVQLDLLEPQLQELDPNSPAAAAIRKMIGEDLTALITGYRRVPEELRSKVHAGQTPDQQLLDGLKIIESEIGDAARGLAEGKLDELATRSRFLELKYQGEEK